ncbi:hypothetical protein CAE01nite_27930 [Cellulomonas aerilata]|uniref:Polysaccharide chain length determinant N-terminal domain-containing protein n=1 Tax=Cellulomonas aerilata TaxID=515326 RepID=A0A512DF19_9CELL|nr:hypothetical protein CAE01nite_27930 [Cellulomonas aerilata]
MWSALRRFWWVVLGITVLTAAAASASAPFVPTPQSTAEGRFLVPVRVVERPDPASPLRTTTPNDAQLLARTYAVILQTDPSILDSVSLQTGASRDELAASMSVEAVESTAVVEVSFTAADEALARAYFTSLNTALTSGVTPNIPVGNLILLQDAQVSSEGGLNVSNRAVGIVAGLLLGLAVAMLLERLDSRIRSGVDLRSMTELPVIDLSRSSNRVAGDVLALRALRLAPDVREVAIVATDRASARIAADLADILHVANQNLSRSATDGDPIPHATWTAHGVLGSGNEGELGVQRSDATVLVLPAGTPVRSADRALMRLRSLDITSVAVALTPAPRRWARARAATLAAAASAAPAADDHPEVERPKARDLAGRP